MDVSENGPRCDDEDVQVQPDASPADVLEVEEQLPVGGGR